MQVSKAALLYFVLVFGAGFVVATVRSACRHTNGRTHGVAHDALGHHSCGTLWLFFIWLYHPSHVSVLRSASSR